MPPKKVPQYKMVPIESIRVPSGRRTAEVDSVLGTSIKNRGLLFPIIITANYILIIGSRRLDVCKKLGWKYIPVKIMRSDKHGRKLIEVQESLSHKKLNYLEEIKQEKEYKELYQAKYPETRWGNNHDRNEVRQKQAERHKSFTEVIAEKLGVSKRKIEMDIKLAEEISDEAAKRIVNTKIANKRNQLVRLAKHDHETQLKLAAEIARGTTNDVRGAEINLKLCGRRSVKFEEFYSQIESIRFKLDKANQASHFQSAIDGAAEDDLLNLISRIEEIHRFATNWLEYYERNKPRLLDAA